ncbi:MAG: uncharacterized protein KVP18_002120 [Porospora cf. gigantea A]|uniref:uncharacterized protein n=1 Tax=Porospora cf. gigantea A TaxID=2853593 RepID=UPI00355A9788|nr:MAG: hypothetical protein KVP18_002120 [Porospora cf. gigantea A]
MTQVLIALGSNMGNRLNCLEQGIHQVNSLPDTAVVNSSSLYSSAPAYDHLSGDHYLNCAIHVTTTIPVEEFWTRLSGIEELVGGVKCGRNAPRYLDLDIVYYGKLSCNLCYYGGYTKLILTR